MSRKFTDSERENDPNYQAFMRAKKEGAFDGMEAGTYVAFFNGLLIASGASYEELNQQEEMQNLTADVYVDQVHVVKPVANVRRGPRLSSNRR